MKALKNITESEFNKLKTSKLTYKEMKELINSLKVEGKTLSGSRQSSTLWSILIEY